MESFPLSCHTPANIISCFLNINGSLHSGLMAGRGAVHVPYPLLWAIFTDVCIKGLNSSLISPIIKFIVSDLYFVYILKNCLKDFCSKNRIYFLGNFHTVYIQKWKSAL